jgi:hypothetical protein
MDKFGTMDIRSMTSGRMHVRIPAATLWPNQYFISFWLGDRYADFCSLDKAIQVQVDGIGARADLPPGDVGNFYIPTRWNCRPERELHSPVTAGWMETL